MKGTSEGGKIVQVQGGHILQSTSRKDRHSKVYTAKGPRDRRVRLSAHTAIQFYDVQDRLGYDRPSKAIDWLIGKAKVAIDRLNNKAAAAAAAAAGYQDSNPSSSDHPPLSFPSPGIGLIQSGFNNPAEDGGLVRSLFPAVDYLGLSLQSFQECFNGWSDSDREVVVQSTTATATLGDHRHHHQLSSWNLHRPLPFPVDHQNPAQTISSDFGTPFQFGYGRNYEEEEPGSGSHV